MSQGDGGGRDPGRRPLRPHGRRRVTKRARLALAVGAALALAAAPAAWPGSLRAQDEPGSPDPAQAGGGEEPPRRSELVTVTATREESRVEDAPASVAVLPRQALEATAAPSLDDALRQVAGFSLFRRSGSRYANPTSQGVSLRGLGASGASRALVLVDGLPLNDPFGGWVYWGRVPRLAIERLEVLRGGASDLYGSSALGGVVQVLTRSPGSGPALDLEASGGGLGTWDGSLRAAGVRGAWGARFAAEGFSTEGYVPVALASRGAVDTSLASRHGALDLLGERRLRGGGLVFARVAGYGEDRDNGTPLQLNDTRLWSGALGADWGEASGGLWTLRGFGQSQLYHQSFTAVASDRSREDLTRRQRVPATAFGLSVQRSQALGARHRLLAGLEARLVDGVTEEIVFVRGAASSEIEAGGEERTAAAFVEDLFQAHPRLLLAGSLRLDGWWHVEGSETTLPLATGVAARTAFPRRSESALSPRAALLFRAAPGVSLLASAYGAFRGPTLNELYRSFRLGDTLTQANAQLRAERLRGGEAGALLKGGPATLRATLFQAGIRDGVANVTVSSTPSLVTRQRQNLGRSRSRGVELEGELLLGRRGGLNAGYVLTDARVTAFVPDQSLVGRRVPQIPRHQLTLQARYDAGWQAGVQARWTSAAFDDDRNQLVLEGGWQVDALLSRALTSNLRAFVAAENVLDAALVVARTPVPTLAPPRTLRAGLRLRR